jgi:hypothetical protein
MSNSGASFINETSWKNSAPFSLAEDSERNSHTLVPSFTKLYLGEKGQNLREKCQKSGTSKI